MMKTAAINQFGPPSAIKVHERPVPKPGPGEVLIRLDTAGVGSWDSAIRDGTWRPPGRTKFPLVLGTDGAGVVVARGARVRRFRVGDRVYAYEFGNSKGGFYAEYVAAKIEHVARVRGGENRRLDALQAVDEVGDPGQVILFVPGARPHPDADRQGRNRRDELEHHGEPRGEDVPLPGRVELDFF